MSPVETVRTWVEARNGALQNGNMHRVRALTAPTCGSCEGILDPIEKVYKAGGHFETAGWQILGARLKSRTPTLATVSVGLEFAGGRTVSESGAKPVSYDAEKHIALFRLTALNDGWRVKFIGFIS